MDDGILDEAYRRLHRTGPEFEGWLSNHGPMAVEALARHGHDAKVHRWLDAYLRRLDELPRGLRPIDDWRVALGDPKRAGDWLAHFDRELRERPWRDILGTWWPRLLPGIAAGATHGVIRVGHAVRALRADETSPDRRTELGQALAYWAARWQPVPGASLPPAAPPVGKSGMSGENGENCETGVAAALAGLPRIADRTGGIRERLGRLPDVPGWGSSLAALRPARTPAEAQRGLAELAHRAGLDYLRYGQAEPVMLVHAVTAPTAVLRTLPELDPGLWASSLAAAWSATAAVTAVYASPTGVAPPAVAPGTPAEVFARAARHGDEHVVKLADAVLDAHATTGDERVLAAAGYAAQLI
ncbi:questin oxidase family protein [Micromonospora sp. WMMD956]|uniref:questin oxidase family protein n=1 Tax=Micromonospora sp. WMMD956 TaxID=3016108 RepID=UPI002416E58A|nr:questin oxidase family protein [Micromonospora sp. WMMD956]MDG4816365.1 questin oxidase family protein [Micromonospora sp. WMMD956]